MELYKFFYDTGVLPVVTMDSVEHAVGTAQALCAGGIPVMEMTLRTGTVLTVDQAKAAQQAGARFIVSPGFSVPLADWCREQALPFLPGCVTPSEILAALDAGLWALKYFPAKIHGGLAGMKLLSGPFPQVRFVPTGGIDAANFVEYLRAPFVQAVGGSWVCPAPLIQQAAYGEIEARAAAASAAVRELERGTASSMAL